MQTNSNITSINFLEQWKPLGVVGSGSTCDVLLVQDSKTLETQVVKLFKPCVKTDMIEAEAELLTTLNHPRILSASGYFPNVVIPVSETESQQLRALALEWVPNGDLLALIQSFGSFSEEIAKAYFLQLVDALDYLHGKGICHLDIKPDNILVDQCYNLKLADLGVAMEVPKACTVKGKVGTAPYHSPEMHLDRAYNAYQADFFALGITLFTMVTGNMPFKIAKASDPLYRLIIEGKFEKFWAFHENILTSKNSLSKSFKSLMESMLAFEVSKRLSLEEMKDHSWVQGIPASEDIIFTLITSVISKPNCSEEQIINTNVPCLNEGIVSAAC